MLSSAKRFPLLFNSVIVEDNCLYSGRYNRSLCANVGRYRLVGFLGYIGVVRAISGGARISDADEPITDGFLVENTVSQKTNAKIEIDSS